MSAKKKVTLYFPEFMLEQLKEECLRQDRSISWLMQRCWRLSRHHIQDYPGVDDTLNAQPETSVESQLGPLAFKRDTDSRWLSLNGEWEIKEIADALWELLKRISPTGSYVVARLRSKEACVFRCHQLAEGGEP